MIGLSKKIVGGILVLVVLVSAYLTIVQVVNGAGPGQLFKSFDVRSARISKLATEFVVGDVLEFEAECKMVSVYGVRIYRNSSLVFEMKEEACGSVVKVHVPLNPPAFNVGGPYTAFLDVSACNSPVPGAFFMDSKVYVFNIVSVETRLEVCGAYDGEFGTLRLCANLTDADGYPVVDEAVDFSVMFSKRRSLTAGWFPLGSGSTDVNGTAMLSLAFNAPSGNYSVKAEHRGNENFGACENTTVVEVSPDESFGFYGEGGAGFGGGSLFAGGGNVSIAVGTLSPYAALPMNVTVLYTTDTPLGGPWRWMVFYCDYVNKTGNLGTADLTLVDSSGPYKYSALFAWNYPDLTGPHTFFAGVVVGFGDDLEDAIWNGSGIIDLGSVNLNFMRCPSNLVVNFPESVCGDVLPVTVAFSKPGQYVARDSGGFASCSLSVPLEYCGLSYMIDETVEGIPVCLYRNGSLVETDFTDDDGLVSIPVPAQSANASFGLSIMAVVNESGLLYQSVPVERLVAFSNVSVRDVAFGGSSSFSLNYTLRENGQANNNVYVEAEQKVDVEAKLFNMSVWNASVSALIGKPLGRSSSRSLGWIYPPMNSRFLRVECLYDIAASTAATLYPETDITGDGHIDGDDLIRISKAFGSYPGHSKWNWRADVNFDLQVDGTDLICCSNSFGKNVTYLSIIDYSVVNVVFYLGSEGNRTVSLDPWGCASIPSGTLKCCFYVSGKLTGAVAESFDCDLHQTSYTDNLGAVTFSWVPQKIGAANTPPSGPCPYYVLAWTPPRLQVLLSGGGGATNVNAQLVVYSFLNVSKRPVNLVLTNSSYARNTTVFNVAEDAYVSEADPNRNFGERPELLVGFDHNREEYRTYIKFNISAIPANSSILSAKLKLYCGSSSLSMERDYEICRVTGDWNEMNIKWNNQPAHDRFTQDQRAFPGEVGWWSWDVTEDVRLWYSGSAVNYGHVIEDGWGKPIAGYDDLYRSLYSREESGAAYPRLEVTYVNLTCFPVNLTAELRDGVSGDPFSNVPVNFTVNGDPCSFTTNSSGVAETSLSCPSGAVAYNVVACYAGNETCQNASARLCVDFRNRADLWCVFADHGVSINDSVPVAFNVSTFEQNYFFCYVQPLVVTCGENVSVYVNGSLYTTSVFDYESYADFSWTALSMGVYYLNVSYGGSLNHEPSEVVFVALADASPVSLCFNVTPLAFEAGETVLVWAQAVNPMDGKALSPVRVDFYPDGTFADFSYTGTGGVATFNWTYPDDGKIHTIMAKVYPNQNLANVTLAVEPVTLSVGVETRLLFQLGKESTSTLHVIYGRLVQARDYQPVPNQTVKLSINGTAYTFTTNGTGWIRFQRQLQPVNGTLTIYQIQASFEGTNPQTANLTATDPYGQSYAVCTTIQYELRPSFNNTRLRVTPPGTDFDVQTKTQEEMQKEVEQKGWLKIWGEPTGIWPPWYRIRIRITVNETIIDVGFSPFSGMVFGLFGLVGEVVGSFIKLPGGETLMLQGLEVFREVIDECITEFMMEAATLMAEYAFAKAGYWKAQPWIAGLALGVELGEELYVLRLYWDNQNEMLTFGIVNIILGLIAVKVDLAVAFIGQLFNIVSVPTMSALYLLMNRAVTAASLSQETTRDPVDKLQIAMNFGFAAYALARYMGWV